MQFSIQVAAKNRESPEKDAIFRLRGSQNQEKERFLCENHFFKIDNFFPVFLREIGLPAVYDQL